MLLVGPPILRECTKQTPPPKPPNSTGKPPSTAPQNPCTQLFFTVTPDTTPENLRHLLNESWQYDPLTTLRLVSYIRTLKGEIKGINEGFCVCALWLYECHPLTLACNLREFASFGSLRDFSEVVYRLIKGQNSHFTRVSRKDNVVDVARRAVSKYVQDSTYRFFHERVSDLFADLLKSDLRSLDSGNVELLSNAAVECPSVDSSIDRHTLLCESIAKKVFPQESDPSYMEIKDDQYVYRVQNRLRKEVLGPLRTALRGKTTDGRGRVRDYTLVFMKKAYQKLMKMKNNASELKYYQIVLAMILKGNGTIFPETPESVIASLNDDNIEEKESEWKDMVQFFSKGKLRNSVAVCDVSEDMAETTKNISVSMAMLISELSHGPWKEAVYGFHQCPKLYKIDGDDLRSKLNSFKQMNCSDRVDVEAILNQILQVSVSAKTSSPEMVERVFIFSNKEFRKSVNSCWGWNYRAVWENYQKYGFDRVPEVVFWNIEGLNSSPPTSRDMFHNRLMTINGYSRSLFAFFVDEDAVLRSDEIKSVTTAEDVMQITLSGKEYQNLVVLD
ncbi:hypothetical protein RND81_14G056900 [Saponaria officinalis]|uniref:Uncharacterized protein n=1 Tax=Saponaria officinalis TaxID=3572 RepID=A0AAW1GI53_SAPOF